MNVQIASHYGMCFGVRDALRTSHTIARQAPATILGQLVHNPLVMQHLGAIGLKQGSLDDPAAVETRDVIITAHGASRNHHEAWRNAGHRVHDTTCPLVHKAHHALDLLSDEGYHPVIIGQRTHSEVAGMLGDHPDASVIAALDHIEQIPMAARLGVIAQTTHPLDHALQLVGAIKDSRPDAEVRFIDTVCHPTKQRQDALVALCRDNAVIVIVGGRNSNNTHQLVQKARQLGATAYQVESVADLRHEWFEGVERVGVTAGTSTLDETVQAVVVHLQRLR